MISPRKGSRKGKERTINEDYDDLHPVITYRHMLAQNPGVRDPLRVIALCDSDAFYAACEMVRLQVDKDTPLVALQWNAIIAVNYPARKFGVTRMSKLQDALALCPELKVVHVATYKEGEAEPGYWDDPDPKTHKVSLDYYRRESVKISTLFRELLQGCEIEKASIDEAFFDFSRPVRQVLLERYPYLAQPPMNAPEGIDTPLPPPPKIEWGSHGVVIPNGNSDEITGGEKSNSEGPIEQKGAGLSTWHDIALAVAAELMDKARAEVLAKLGYSTSAGIGRNKFLAKLAASYRKPNGQSILCNDAIPNYLRPLAFRKIRFLGGKLGDALATEFGAETVGDLLSISLEELQNHFEHDAAWVWEVIRGIDRNEVKEKGPINKSMLASKNLKKPITRASEGHHWIRVLAAELALRLNNARKETPHLWPKTLVLHARKGYGMARSKQTTFPFVHDVTVDAIANIGNKLWADLVGDEKTLNVSAVQLAFSGIEGAEKGLQTIDSFLGAAGSSKRALENEPLPRDSLTETHQGPAPTTGQAQVMVQTYTCKRCGKRLTPFRAGGYNEEEIGALRAEHDDFHFAQDLSRDPDNTFVAQSAQSTAQSQKKRKVIGGIEQFFSRK